MEVAFSPITHHDGYLPISAHGLIGDGTTAALVGRDGSVSWLCLPRFDSPPLFCGLLDRTRGGAFRLAPEDLVESRQYYEPDTAVLVTEMRGRSCLIRLTDALTLRAGADLTEDSSAARGELLRRVTVLDGSARIRMEVAPAGPVRTEPAACGLRLVCARHPGIDLHLSATVPLDAPAATIALGPGETGFFSLRWGHPPRRHQPVPPERRLDETARAWRGWMRQFQYDGPEEPLVRRSAITLKLLDHFEAGGMIAAPTSSLPEATGGVRNWDYRYVWIRDAAFSVYALHRIGHSREAAGFLAWVLDAVERHGRPRVVYDLDGATLPPERIDQELEGYRGSAPVRWGNSAAAQVQHDMYGEILDCAYQWAAHHGSIDEALWEWLAGLVEAARHEWRTPDCGIWEVRTSGRVFTYSAAMCQVALDRAVRLAGRFGLAGNVSQWRAGAERIREAIVEEAWDSDLGSFTQHLGGGALDASLLALPLRRVLPADHPKMIATTDAIRRRLDAGGGLLYRYLPEVSPDGLPGHEGAFLLCSFWLVDNLTGQGRLDEAADLYSSLCGRAGPLGLLPEQIDPSSGEFLGNYPQAFSHIGVISSGVNLTRRVTRAGAAP
ncbi:MAG TPA: glycoside hydrolase family 15 protein [Vicinamibacterales bacterium]|nr:glycoside hydrolase family 15 protein [Vicinamibacterales bacterium]